MTNYEQIIVKKPWGYEYLMYQNGQIGIWCLFIKHGAQTSLHCHPDKKTGLIVLSGEAKIRFMNDEVKLQPLSKLIIRPGLFHSTVALSPEGVVLIEVETPPIKTNLVRFDDAYGREEAPYESDAAMIPMNESCIRLQIPEKGRKETYSLHGCNLITEKVEDITLLTNRRPDEIIIVVEGGLISRTGESVLGAGDVVTIGTINRLAKTFTAPHGLSLIAAQKLSDNPT